MSRRSRSSATPLPWQLAVVLAIACLGWIQEASCLRTTPFIGKYTREKLDSLRGAPVEEVEPEEIVTEAVVIPVREPSNSAYQVGIVAKSTASPQEAIGEGGNGTVKSLYTGIPQIDYVLDPNLPRELNGFNLTDYPFYVAVPPDITFKCDGLHDGFYASVPHKCQVYHHCLFGTRYDFLCANYTAFDQKTFICHFVSEVDCGNSPKYYNRNEALYKAASTTTTSTTTTTTTTTPAPAPVPQSLGQSSGGRVGQGGRRRRPMRRRRPQYDYYYDDDYAEEDDVEYSRPAQPPRRRKKKPLTFLRDREEDDFSEEEDFPDEEEYVNRRRKQKPRTRPQSNRRPIEDDFGDEYEDDLPEKSTASVALVPVGTPASRGKGVFDKPRAPPKIRPPVPLSEREKYNYGRQGAAGSSSPAASPSKPSYSESEEEPNDRRNKKRPSQPPPLPAGRDEDSEEEIPERRTKKRPTQPPRRAEVPEDEVPERRIKKRPTQPPPQASVRDEHYYEDDDEEEYERIPPSRGSNQNRRRKGQGSTRVEQVDSEEDDYEYKNPSSSRDTTRYSSSSGSRESSRRRKRPQAAASSVPARRRRPSYRQEEDDYAYEDEEDTRVRPSNTRFKNTQLKGSDDEEYIDRAPPSRNPPSRSSDDASARKRAQPSNFRSSFSEDRPRPLSSVHNKRKRLPAPVHEEPEEDRSAEEVPEEEEGEEIPPPPKERSRGGDRVRFVKQRVSTTTTTPKPPPPTPRIAPRTTSTLAPIPAREKDLYEEDDDGDYYESEEIHEKEPKTPEPVNSRRPFRPSGPSNSNGGSLAISGRSVPAAAPQAFLPRGLQALGDRAQRKDSGTSVTNNNSTPKPKPTSYTTTATTTTPSVVTTKVYKKDEPKYFERPLSITSNPPSYKPQTQYNARQPTPKQEAQEPPQVTSYTRAPFISNARPGYTTKNLPAQLYPQKPQQNIAPPQVPVDSVPNQTDYEEDDFINDALHPTIPSSPGFPVTAAASSLTTRHGIPLSQQQRTTLSTPTQLSYRFRNTAQSSPILDYRAQQSSSNPSFTSRGAPLHTSASQQTISVIQPPQFISQPNQQRVALRAVQQPLQQLLHQQASNHWNGPTRIVVY